MKVIPLRNRRREVAAEVLVDDSDYEWLNQWRWSFHNQQYASRNNVYLPDGRIYMHRLILGLERGDRRECDHINHNKLDNRRMNLRIVSPAANKLNHPGFATATSKYRGVSWYKSREKWRAQITAGGRAHHIGYYDDELAAARAVVAFLIGLGVPKEALPCV